MIGFLKKYWLSVLFLLIIFILCFINTADLPAPPTLNFDKVVHTILFLGLAGVIFFDNTGYLRIPISKARVFLSSFLFPVAIGGLIEILQSYLTTTRSGDWFDFLFDGIGAFFGWGIALLINRYFLLKKTLK
ncbi:MAG: VanZ family protein [Candidatus Azobacteroides sp.]|nr:VanZ family protein [Candidatus Azobacteroides sp.]